MNSRSPDRRMEKGSFEAKGDQSGFQRLRISSTQSLVGTFIGALGPGDGIDPRFDKRDSQGSDRQGYAQFRLAAQIQRTFGIALPDAHPALEGLYVCSVEPGRGGSFVVTVTSGAPSQFRDSKEVLGALESVKGGLRNELAGYITRKRLPELTFRYV